ncbi:hypothetical protein ACOJUR_15700 [Alicyclobacillus tolerans]|uniref:Uncharacterized protein n=1 Tax=Alicyclobacillus tolerans TaxID=90970 RepID=A0ABT9LYM6_9BACL|nr:MULTISPECIES: hypothetical protein [Alicyclobacillus]MDP9729375.1 hypothetical protein [Alicyclobacillus tengchongensis]
MGNNVAPQIPNVTNTLGQLGFHPINPFTFLSQITHSFGSLIETVFAWIYYLSEIAVLVGALVFVVGAIGHNSRIKRTGAHIVLYAILGFVASILLPGILVSINNHLHG